MKYKSICSGDTTYYLVLTNIVDHNNHYENKPFI